MLFMKTLRCWVGILLAAVSLSTQAQPKLSCPVDWSSTTDLAGAGPGGLDVVVMGVRVRDWKPEYLDLLLQRRDECERASPNPQSVKDAERKFAVERVQMLKGYLRQRDANLEGEVAAQGARMRAQESGSRQISTNSSGTLLLHYDLPGSGTSEMSCLDFGRFGQPWGRLPRPLQDDLPCMYRACVQAGQLPPGHAEKVKEWVEQLQAQRRAALEYVAAVQALAVSPQNQTHQTVSAIEDRPLSITDEAVQAAEGQLKEMRRAVDARECAAYAKRASLSAELLTGWYLMEWATPVSIQGMACRAGREGVQFRYQSGGLLGSEAIEIKGRRTVEVTVSRQKMPDGAVLLVPVKSTVNGNSKTVTRANIQELAFHIRSALVNQ
jgi:hypothetical protein